MGTFDKLYVSEFTRAVETAGEHTPQPANECDRLSAAMLDIPQADWSIEYLLRERDNGKWQGAPKGQQEGYARNAQSLARW